MDAGVNAPLFQKGSCAQNGCVVFLGEEPAHVEDLYGVVEGVVLLFLAGAQVDAVGHQAYLFFGQAVDLHNGLPDFPGQGHGQGPAPAEAVFADLLVQEDCLLGGLIVDGMDDGNPGRGQSRVFQGVEMGVDQLGIEGFQQFFQLSNALQPGAQGLVQIVDGYTGCFQPLTYDGFLSGKAYGGNLVAVQQQLTAQGRAHGFCAAHAKAWDDLNDSHCVPPVP